MKANVLLPSITIIGLVVSGVSLITAVIVSSLVGILLTALNACIDTLFPRSTDDSYDMHHLP